MRLLEFFHRLCVAGCWSQVRCSSSDLFGQKFRIKFYQELGDSQSQTIREIRQVLGEDAAVGVTQV